MAAKWYVVFNPKTGNEIARFKRGVDAVLWVSDKKDLDLKQVEF